ncbi:MAG: hypothetical protein LQ342_005911 [Letrouitia transgressa]|nr:MAG: hypothetical protein LQ342_005911 [Letrouitia transgressa]
MSANGGYTLGKGYSASVSLNQELNFQHYLWKEQLGYLIHPRIPQDQDQEGGLRIADVGTGTG